ncbi:MAG: hypothetical protein ABJN84_03340 [Flavobacteriaceae bacterium]
MNKTITKLGLFFISVIFLQSCAFDLQTGIIKKEGVTSMNEEKGKQILNAVWKQQGYDKLDQSTVYSFEARDKWKGMLGKIGQIWPEMTMDLEAKYLTGTFDGQIKYLNGREKGNVIGLQDWNYYEISNGKTTFLDKDHRKNRRKVFGIAAFQYFTEMVSRLRTAPIISYAGEKDFRGQSYHLVFCTWESTKAHKEHDQYLVWINKKTNTMDIVQYTLRDNYLKMPGAQMMGGAIEFSNLKSVDGVMIPFTQYMYAIKPRKKTKRYLHKLELSSFSFDAFDKNELIADESKETGGNYKK